MTAKNAIVNGREVNSNTAWWLKSGPGSFVVFCVHNVPLERPCAACPSTTKEQHPR